jgi:hypothetical protein
MDSPYPKVMLTRADNLPQDHKKVAPVRVVCPLSRWQSGAWSTSRRAWLVRLARPGRVIRTIRDTGRAPGQML